MTYLGAIIVLIILIALVVGFLYGPLLLWREKPHKSSGGPPYPSGANTPRLREHYGPPPGMYRAISHEELPNRGWPEFPLEYTGNSVSALSHMIERSA
jgi:hypothetical protein